MTHTDFNHLLSSIKGLSPEQLRQLRQQLDRQLAQPKKPTAPTPGKAAKRAKAAAPKKKPLTRRRVQSAIVRGRPHRLAARSCPRHRRRRSRRCAGPHQGRAAVGNHHPRTALRWRPPTSSIPAPWSNAMSWKPARPGCAASRAADRPLIYTFRSSPPLK